MLMWELPNPYIYIFKTATMLQFFSSLAEKLKHATLVGETGQQKMSCFIV